jgi:hypothetical protein
MGLVGSRTEETLLTGNLNLADKYIDHSLLISYRVVCECDGSQPNMSIEKFVSGNQRHNYRGPVVVVRNSLSDSANTDDMFPEQYGKSYRL